MNEIHFLKKIIKAVLFAFSVIYVWQFTLLYVPTGWHLLIGWVSCSAYNAIFDFQKIIDEL